MTKNDIKIIIIILAAAGVLWLINNIILSRDMPEKLNIYQENILFRSIKLPVNQKINIDEKDKRWLIQIDGYRARIISASCPLKSCVKQGWIERPGETAVCLPQKLSMELIGKAKVNAITK